MKKRSLVSVILALALLLCALPAMGEEEVKVVIPLPSALSSAVFGDAYFDDEDVLTIIYNSAEEEDLDYYLLLCSFENIFKYEMEDGAGYYLLAPGAGVIGEAYYLPDSENVVIFVLMFTHVAEDEAIGKQLELLERDIELPENAAGNVAPQFYAVAGRQPYHQGTSASSSLFDNQMSWTEYYDEIDAEVIRNYTVYMAMFGYDVQASGYLSRPEENMEIIRLRYSNGDAEIVVDYDVISNRTTVYYEPGVSYYLLDGAAMNDAFGY